MFIMNSFNKGIILTSLGSFWWGFLGVIYFKFIAYAGPIEVVVHRSIWTTVTLLITTLIFSKWFKIKEIFNFKKKLFILFVSGLLIFTNWSTWIYAVWNNQIIDASFGYFIMPIISIFFGYFFCKEKLSKKGFFSVFIVLVSILIFQQQFSQFNTVIINLSLVFSIISFYKYLF